MIASLVCKQTCEGGEERTAANGSDNPGSTSLGVTAETAKRQGENGREDAGFEEEDKRQHGNTAFAMDVDRADNEDDDHGREQKEHPSRLDEHEEAGCSKSAEGEETLANSVAVGRIRCTNASTLLAVLDELRRDCNLRAYVTELCCDAEEELVLLSEWDVFVTSQIRALLSLERHVCICNFWNWGEEEDDSEQEDESCNTNVCPLDFGEIVDVSVREEDMGCEERGDDGADSLDRLRKLETKL